MKRTRNAEHPAAQPKLASAFPRRSFLWLAGLGGCAPHVVDLLQPSGGEGFAAAEVDVRWDEPLGPIATGAQYGLNLFLGLDPRTANRDEYMKALRTMAPGLVRLSRSDMMADSDANGSGWMKAAATPEAAWDRDKIAKLFPDGLPFRPHIMVNVPEWPAAMGPTNRPLAPEHHEAFANLAADLVRVLNVEQKRGVQSFEIFSELESAYDGRAEEQGALVARVARAMKAIDPNVQVGGPSLVHPWHPNLNAFLRGSEGAIDFVSYHGFGGNGTPDVEAALGSARSFGERAGVVKAAASEQLSQTLAVYHTLYNITAAAPNAVLTGMDSALFDALALRSFVVNGVAGAAAWNEADGWFGKIDTESRPRPAAHVFSLFNAHMRGALIATDTSAADVAVFGVASAGAGGLALINVGSGGLLVRLRERPSAPSAGTRRTVYTVTEAGLAQAHTTSGSLSDPAPGGGLPVPARSVVVVTAA